MHQNYYAGRLNWLLESQNCLHSSLYSSILRNNFDGSTKLFSDLYPAKFF